MASIILNKRYGHTAHTLSRLMLNFLIGDKFRLTTIHFGGLSAGLITPATKTIDHVCKIPEDCHLVRLLVCLVIENHWTDFDVTFHNQQLMIPVTF